MMRFIDSYEGLLTFCIATGTIAAYVIHYFNQENKRGL